MRPTAFGLVVAMLATMLVPATAMAQRGKPAAAAPGGVSEAARKTGMAEAPTVVTAAGIPCQVADARFVGKQEDKKAKTSVSYYEVACATGGMGYVVQQPSGGAATAFTCVEANTPPAPGQPPAIPCMLPANADPKAALVPMMVKAGVQCVPANVRGIGQSKTNTYMEVACQDGNGYVLVASSPFDASKDLQAQNCLNFDDGDGNIKCALSDKATRLRIVDTYAAAAKNNCAVKDRRFVGAAKDGSNYFEAACEDGKGYIYKVASNGSLATTYDCAKAQGILGGCELTNAREAATEQAALYTRLAKGVGSNCDVDRYAVFPAQPGEDIVELACKDGTSAVGIFKTGGKGQVLNCGYALVAGYKCGLSKVGSGNDILTADLKKFDKKDCAVSNTRLAAKTTKGTTLLEVACADGLKGYMIEYSTTPAVSAVGVIACTFAGNCKLPGNV